MELVTDQDLLDLGEEYSEQFEESENIKFQEDQSSDMTSKDIELFLAAMHENKIEYIIQHIAQIFLMLKTDSQVEQVREVLQNLMTVEPKVLNKYFQYNKQLYEKLYEMLNSKTINVQLLHFVFFILTQIINYNAERQNKFIAFTTLTKIYQASLQYLFQEYENKKIRTFLLAFYLSYYNYCPYEYQRQRQFRKLLRTATESNIFSLKAIDIIKQLVNNLAVQSQRELFINLIKQLTTFTVELINHRRLIGLFSTSAHKKNTYKEGKSNKSKKSSVQVSLEERVAEKIAQAGTLMFLKLVFQLLKQNSYQQTNCAANKKNTDQTNTSKQVSNNDLYFPIIENIQYQIHYLLQYPRCFPYILYVVQLYCKDVNYSSRNQYNYIYIPCQQTFLGILYQIILPLGKKSLDINPLQYRGKLMNDQGKVEFRRQFCIPKQFYQTMQCREALMQLIYQTMIIYFTSILRYRPITFPEVSQVFQMQLQDIIHILTEHNYTSSMLGFKVTYNSFQLSSVRSFAKQLRMLRTALRADSDYIKELRVGINNDQYANENLCALINQSQLQLLQLKMDKDNDLDTQIEAENIGSVNYVEQLDQGELLDEEEYEEEVYESDYEEELDPADGQDIVRKLNL